MTEQQKWLETEIAKLSEELDQREAESCGDLLNAPDLELIRLYTHFKQLCGSASVEIKRAKAQGKIGFMVNAPRLSLISVLRVRIRKYQRELERLGVSESDTTPN